MLSLVTHDGSFAKEAVDARGVTQVKIERDRKDW
jgi:hypothetical protein